MEVLCIGQITFYEIRLSLGRGNNIFCLSPIVEWLEFMTSSYVLCIAYDL